MITKKRYIAIVAAILIFSVALGLQIKYMNPDRNLKASISDNLMGLDFDGQGK